MIAVGAGTYPDNLVIDRDVTIVGEGAGSTVIDGGGVATTVVVPAGVTAVLEELTVTGGWTEADGGGVDNAGSITLRGVDLADNAAVRRAFSRGGGLWNNAGTVVVEGSTLSGNVADSGGAAIYSVRGTVTVTDSVIAGNTVTQTSTDFRGGAIHGVSAVVDVSTTRIVDNVGGFSGGGFQIRGSGGRLDLRESTVSGNSAGSGAGIDLRQSARAFVDSSTISDNTASRAGGGLRVQAPVELVNSTVSGNVADSLGGGIDADSSVTLDAVTIVGNSSPFGGGIYERGSVLAESSVIAGNTGGSGPDCFGEVAALGTVFVGDATDCSVDAGNILTGDPGLGPLADNGGPTATHAPDVSSPLIDQGSTGLGLDQRGAPRPAGAGTDVGAVEIQQEVDSTPPEWPADAELAASASTDRSVRLSWPAASDGTGVSSYVVVAGKQGEVASAGGDVTSVVVEDLAPDTEYRFTIVAYDAAGNERIGPSVTVRTLPADAVGHLGPDPGSPTTAWVEAVPFEDIDSAAQIGGAVVVTSTGSTSPVVTPVGLGSVEAVDVDRDGLDDVTVRVDVDVTPTAPWLLGSTFTVTSLRSPGLGDVEALAFVPIDPSVDPGFGAGALVSGFRTLAADGSAGGSVPASQTVTVDAGRLSGLDHEIGVDASTTAPDGQLRFLVGVASGDRVDLRDSDLLSMTVSDVPSAFETAWRVSAPAAGAEPAIDASWEWASPIGEPRPTVSLAYLENEGDPSSADDLRTEVVFDPVAHRQTVTLTDSVATSAAELSVTADAANDSIAVIHSRPGDGYVVTFGATDAVRGLSASVGHDGNLVVTGNTYPLDLAFELVNPTTDLFAGALSRPIVSLAGVVQRTYSVEVEPSITPDGLAVDISSPNLMNLGFIAAPADGAVLPDDQSFAWPTGPPSGWAPLRPDDPLTGIGLIDDASGTGFGIALTEVASASYDATVASIAQRVTVETRERSDLDARVLVAGGIDARCTGRLGAGNTAFDMAPPSAYSLDADQEALDIDCRTAVGDRRASLTAGRVPATTSIDLDVADRGSGSVVIDPTDANGDPSTVLDLDLRLADPNGIGRDTALLGARVEVAGVEGDRLPNSRATWRNSERRVGVIADSLDDETAIGRLEILLATDDPYDLEGQVVLPATRHVPSQGLGVVPASDSTHFARLWVEPGPAGTQDRSVVLGAQIVDATHFETVYNKLNDRILGDVVGQRVERPFVADVMVPARSVFSGQRAVNGTCSIGIPLGNTQTTLRLPDLVDAVSAAPAGLGDLACDVLVTDSEFDVRMLAAVEGVPERLRLTVDPGRSVRLSPSTIDPNTFGVIGSAFIEVIDRSGTGLPGTRIADRTLGATALSFTDVPTSRVVWTDGDGELTLTAQSLIDRPIGAVDARFRTRAAVILPDPAPTSHRIRLADEGADGELAADIAVVDLTRLRLTLSDDVEERIRWDLRTSAPHRIDLDLSVDADSEWSPLQERLGVDGAIDELATATVFMSDLVDDHRLVSNSETATVVLSTSLEGSLASRQIAGPEVCAAQPLNDRRLLVDLVARGVPLDFSVRGGSAIAGPGRLIGVSDRLDSIDVVFRDGSDLGVYGSGANRIRVLAETLTDDLDLDLDAMDDRLRISGTAGTDTGHVRVESDHEDEGRTRRCAHWGTGYDRFVVDLERIPARWSVRLDTPSEGPTSLVADLGDAGGAGRVTAFVEREVDTPTDTGPGRPLERFADPTLGLVDRTAFESRTDTRHFPSDVLADTFPLYERPVHLTTREVGLLTAADGRTARETSSVEDHVVLVTGADGDLEYASLAISDLERVSVKTTTGDLDVDVRRDVAGGALYAGWIEHAIARGIDASTGATPSADEGGPDVASGRLARTYGDADRLRIGVASPTIELEQAGEGTLVTGGLSGGAARLVAPFATGENAVELDSWNGVPFVDGEPLVIGGMTVSSVDLTIDERFWEIRLDLLVESTSAADLSTLELVATTAPGARLVGTSLLVPTQEGFLGGLGQEIRWRVCASDNPAACATSVLQLEVERPYEQLTALAVAALPGELSLDLRSATDDEWDPRRIRLRSDVAIGDVAFFSGPVEQPPLADVPVVKAIGDVGATDTFVLLPDGGSLTPGRMGVSADAVNELTLLSQDAAARTVIGLEAEDITIRLRDGSGGCGFGCSVIDAFSVSIDAVGDRTGEAADVHVGAYERISPPADTTDQVTLERLEYVPVLTGWLDGLGEAFGGFQFVLDFGLPEFDVDLNVDADSGEISYWDSGFGIIDDPDYFDGEEPWEVWPLLGIL